VTGVMMPMTPKGRIPEQTPLLPLPRGGEELTLGTSSGI
jgi:hypothetical protein